MAAQKASSLLPRPFLLAGEKKMLLPPLSVVCEGRNKIAIY